MTSNAVAVRRWTTAALLATLALLVLGGLLRATGTALGAPEQLEDLRKLGGMVLGLCVTGLLATALWRRQGPRGVLWPSLGAFLCVGLQGFLGTRVIGPGDRPAMLSAHLLVTLLLVGLLLVTRERARLKTPGPVPPDRARVRLVAVVTLGVIAVQTVLGAHVRGLLDLVVLSEPELPRGQWLTALHSLPQVHRQVGGLVGVGTALLTVFAARCTPRAPEIGRAAATSLVLCIAQAALGFTLVGRDLPPDAQALHLPLAVVLFGVVFAVFLRARRTPASPSNPPSAQNEPAPTDERPANA